MINDDFVDMSPVLCDYTASKPLINLELIFSESFKDICNLFLDILGITFQKSPVKILI